MNTLARTDANHYTHAVCESNEDVIQCEQIPSSPYMRVLDIQFAEYGRKNKYTCPHSSIKDSDCVSKVPLSYSILYIHKQYLVFL